jgi:hypothetical protein
MWRLILTLVEWGIKRFRYKGRIENKLDTVLSRQTDLERRLLRLEILDAMRRDDRAVVHQLYDIYKNEFSGNSYLQELYKDYCKHNNKRSKKC